MSLSRTAIKLIDQSYKGNKKREADDKYIFVDDPTSNTGKRLRFPKSYKSLLEREHVDDEYYLNTFVDKYTSFSWKLKTQRSTYGDAVATRGITLQADCDVLTPGEIIIVADDGLTTNPEDRNNLAKLRYFSYGSQTFNSNAACMRLNTRSLTKLGEVEIENVKLKSMRGELVSKELKLTTPLVGMCVVVINLTSIKKGDCLMVRDYEKRCSMPYGSNAYIQAQLLCYQAYQLAKENAPTGRKVCVRCFQILPKFKKDRPLHNTTCTPYIWNYFPPKCTDI